MQKSTPYIIYINGSPASRAIVSQVKDVYTGSRRDLIETPGRPGAFPQVRSKAIADKVVATLLNLGHAASAKPGRFNPAG